MESGKTFDRLGAKRATTMTSKLALVLGSSLPFCAFFMLYPEDVAT